MNVEQVDSLSEEHVLQLHGLYRREWWTQDRTLEDVRQMLAQTDLIVAFCDRHDGRLVGFARVLTDFTYHALLFDVIVAESHRGRGLGRRLMQAVASHPRLQSVPVVWLCCLPEMVPFYRKWGFTEDVSPIKWMRFVRADEEAAKQ